MIAERQQSTGNVVGKYLTTMEAAERLGITDRRVRKLCSEGRLGQKVGRDYLITSEDLSRFRRVNRRPGRPPGAGQG